MRIATINASVLGGGAEAVALALHTEYRRLGHEAWLLVGNQNAERPDVIQIPNERDRSPWARLLRTSAAASAHRVAHDRDPWWYADRALRSAAEPARYARVARGHEDFDHPGTAHLLDLAPHVPDVLHFHNLHGSYFDVRELSSLTARVPSVLTMHDAWLMTGHCAHPLECERWLTGCGSCPYLERYVPIMADAAADNFAVKRTALGASHLAFATPSRWLMEMAERSGILENAIDARVIPNGVDGETFSPGGRAEARETLGIAPDALVFTCVAKDIATNPYKGFDILLRACELLAGRGHTATLLAIGSDLPGRRIGGIEIRFVPGVEDPARMATYYRASDVYVHPATAEVLGLTILEAMACGLPVAASRVGGIPEVVTNNQTGVLCTPGDATDLAEKLARLLGDRALREHMGSAGAALASVHLTVRVQAQAYLAYYAEVAAKWEHRL